MQKFDMRKLPLIINALGVIVMLIWGMAANDWSHSWIAVAISGVISGVLFSVFGQKKE